MGEAASRGLAAECQATIRREIRRRAGIEPVIGSMEEDGRLGRNFLPGATGDAINVILLAAGSVADMLHFHMLMRAADYEDGNGAHGQRRNPDRNRRPSARSSPFSARHDEEPAPSLCSRATGTRTRKRGDRWRRRTVGRIEGGGGNGGDPAGAHQAGRHMAGQWL